MIQCQSCHYDALGPNDLAGHIAAVHGFSRQAAWVEAIRIAGSASNDGSVVVREATASQLMFENADLAVQLARTTAELAGCREALAQAQHATEAERAAPRIAEARLEAARESILELMAVARSRG